jgi:DNA repair exonuclease SbcCD nuclease subunit
MKWSFIGVADVHMSNSLPYARPTDNGRTDRLEDQMNVWDQIHAAADRYEVDGIIVLGDLFDKSKVDPVTLTHTVEAIMKTKSRIYILPGNHDANSIRGGRFAVEAFREMKNELVEVIGEKPGQSLEVEMEGKRNLAFWPLAFSPVGQTEDELREIRRNMDKNDFNALLVHNSIMGAHHLGWKCDDGLDPRKTCKGFDMVLAGHFHENQELDCGKKTGSARYQYLGAPMHHDFSDVGRESIAWLYEFEDNAKGGLDVRAKKIPIQAPEFFIMEMDDDAPKMKAGDFVRIVVKATHADWASRRRSVEAMVDSFNSKGIRAFHLHKPIYHHKSRMTTGTAGGEGVESFSLENAVSEYVETIEVETIGLKRDKLKTLGLEAWAAVRAEHGIT